MHILILTEVFQTIGTNREGFNLTRTIEYIVFRTAKVGYLTTYSPTTADFSIITALDACVICRYINTAAGVAVFTTTNASPNTSWFALLQYAWTVHIISNCTPSVNITYYSRTNTTHMRRIVRTTNNRIRIYWCRCRCRCWNLRFWIWCNWCYRFWIRGYRCNWLRVRSYWCNWFWVWSYWCNWLRIWSYWCNWFWIWSYWCNWLRIRSYRRNWLRVWSYRCNWLRIWSYRCNRFRVWSYRCNWFRIWSYWCNWFWIRSYWCNWFWIRSHRCNWFWLWSRCRFWFWHYIGALTITVFPRNIPFFLVCGQCFLEARHDAFRSDGYGTRKVSFTFYIVFIIEFMS